MLILNIEIDIEIECRLLTKRNKVMTAICSNSIIRYSARKDT